MKNIKFIILLGLLFIKSVGQIKDENNIENKIKQIHKKTDKVRDSVHKLISVCNDQIKVSVSNTVLSNQLNLDLNDLWNVYDENLRLEVKNDLEFAKNNPNSLMALKLIRTRLTRQEGMCFYDTYKLVYNNFTDEIKNSDEGKEMLIKLNEFKQSKIGSSAPDFVAKDINGDILSVKDFLNNKYVLIDFWASWCGPCREELAYIKELYAKYNKKGLEIISISKDEDLIKWKNAIIKEGIENWKHISILENDNTIEKKYFVSGVPHKILIDKSGIIIGKWKGSGKNNKDELLEILNNIFKNKKTE